MKIMIVEPLGDGGIAHYTLNLINALEKIDINVTLVTAKNYEFFQNNNKNVYPIMFRMATYLIKRFPELDREAAMQSLARRFLKTLEYPINSFQAVALAHKKKIKIVHFQSVNLIELLMIVLFKFFNVKIIYTIHNVMPRHKRIKFYHKLLYRAMYFFCDRIIIHSQKGRGEVIDLFVVNESKIHVIPHGDYKFFIPDKILTAVEAKLSLGIDPKCQTILFFGAIRSNKGLKNILMALPKIQKKVQDFCLLIVGESCEDYTRYKNIIISNRTEKYVWEKIEYIPNNEVSDYFFASDVVVLPYNEITGSGVLQIAYAFSKPIIASDIPGFREVIVDGKNGYLVDPKDSEMIAERIINIFLDEGKKKKMGQYSRFLSDTKYSWDTIAKKTNDIYKLLVLGLN